MQFLIKWKWFLWEWNFFQGGTFRGEFLWIIHLENECQNPNDKKYHKEENWIMMSVSQNFFQLSWHKRMGWHVHYFTTGCSISKIFSEAPKSKIRSNLSQKIVWIFTPKMHFEIPYFSKPKTVLSILLL